MPHEPRPNTLSLWGFVIWGDFSDMTTYMSKRGKLVWFKKTWPDAPPSDKQLEIRAIWRAGAAAWKALLPEEREQWELATRRASLCMTGYNLWMYWWISADDRTIRTLEDQTDTELLAAEEGSGSG